MIKQKKSLIESLKESGVLTTEQIKEAQEEEKSTNQSFRKIIIKKGFISDEDLVSFIASNMSLMRIELSNYIIEPKMIELIPDDLAKRHQVIPLFKIGNKITCAMADPLDIFAIDELHNKTGFDIDAVIATEKEIKKSLDEHYGAKGAVADIMDTLDKEKFVVKEGEEIQFEKLEEVSSEPPVVRLVNLMVMQAVQEKSSDIHIEPEEKSLKVRYRIDGILHNRHFPPKYLQPAIVSRIKILANLNIAEHRAPQDGRFQMKIGNNDIDIRVSVVPTVYGENVVMRLLDRSSVILNLSDLGFSKNTLGKYEKLIRKPYGIILVTGPTGSGKTTTLYASLNVINSEDKNIITVEDPVEYHLTGIRQIHVDPKSGITFATGLRAILRQDPDIIMIGEIRDTETAEIAVQSALTGHLVFSTLHTNDAPGSIIRLVDMGIEPFLVSSSIIGVLAQRLVRTICKDCKVEHTPSAEVLKDIGITENGQKFYRGKGCHKCMNTGYKGRLAIFELMIPDAKMHDLIIAKASKEEIAKHAQTQGMNTLREDGIQKVKEKVSTIEEVLRITQ